MDAGGMVFVGRRGEDTGAKRGVGGQGKEPFVYICLSALPTGDTFYALTLALVRSVRGL